MLFELTRDYLIIVPSLAAVGISYWISTNFLQYRKRGRGGPGARPGPVQARGTKLQQPMSVEQARQLLSEAKDSEVTVSEGPREVTIVVSKIR